MKITEIVELIKEDKPKMVERVGERRVATLIRDAFGHILNTMETQEEGVLRVPKLGNFRIRMVESEVDGDIVSEKRIMFRPEKPAPEVDSSTSDDAEKTSEA